MSAQGGSAAGTAAKAAGAAYDQSGRYDSSILRQVFENSFTYLAGFERNVHRFANRTAV